MPRLVVFDFDGTATNLGGEATFKIFSENVKSVRFAEDINFMLDSNQVKLTDNFFDMLMTVYEHESASALIISRNYLTYIRTMLASQQISSKIAAEKIDDYITTYDRSQFAKRNGSPPLYTSKADALYTHLTVMLRDHPSKHPDKIDIYEDDGDEIKNYQTHTELNQLIQRNNIPIVYHLATAGSYNWSTEKQAFLDSLKKTGSNDQTTPMVTSPTIYRPDAAAVAAMATSPVSMHGAAASSSSQPRPKSGDAARATSSSKPKSDGNDATSAASMSASAGKQ